MSLTTRTDGSLFLWHICLEGRPIEEGSEVAGKLAAVLSQLPTYQRVARDIKGYKGALNDALQSIEVGGPLLFEAANVVTVVRHCGILLSFLERAPKFGRFSPIEFVRHRFANLDFPLFLYRRLYGAKLWVEGKRVSYPNIVECEVRELIESATRLISYMEERITKKPLKVWQI